MTREEAIEELQYIKDSLVSCELSYDALDMAIKSLSADVRENVKGEWIDEKRLSYEYDGNEVTLVTWKCSKCGEETNIRSNFCPDCGADMRGEV